MKHLLVRICVLCVLLLICTMSLFGYTGNTVGASGTAAEAEVSRLLDLKHTLRFGQDGKFKIVIFADIQDKYPLEQDTLDYMNKILDKEKPDLVLLGGDNHCGGLRSESLLKTYLTAMSQPMESRKIPWAQIYGNHVEGGHNNNIHQNFGAPSKERQQQLFESFEYNVSKGGDVYGVGNYVLPILRSDSDKIAFNVFGLDTHSYLNENPGGQAFADKVTLPRPIYGGLEGSAYETVHFDQIRWYWNTSVALEKYNSSKIPAMMYFHIALNEWNYIAKNPTQTNMVGENREGVWPSELNSGLFNACYERGDVKGMFVGHCHRNDFVGEYMGIKLGFTPTIGSYEYYDADNRGARVIEIYQDDAFNFTTRMVYTKNLK